MSIQAITNEYGFDSVDRHAYQAQNLSRYKMHDGNPSDERIVKILEGLQKLILLIEGLIPTFEIPENIEEQKNTIKGHPFLVVTNYSISLSIQLIDLKISHKFLDIFFSEDPLINPVCCERGHFFEELRIKKWAQKTPHQQAQRILCPIDETVHEIKDLNVNLPMRRELEVEKARSKEITSLQAEVEKARSEEIISLQEEVANLRCTILQERSQRNYLTNFIMCIGLTGVYVYNKQYFRAGLEVANKILPIYFPSIAKFFYRIFRSLKALIINESSSSSPEIAKALATLGLSISKKPTKKEILEAASNQVHLHPDDLSNTKGAVKENFEAITKALNDAQETLFKQYGYQ